MLNYNEYKMTDFIRNYKDTDITFDKMYLKKILTPTSGKYVMPIDNILDKYSDELDKLKMVYTMGEAEKRIMFYNPKAFSYKLYGTTELWYMILYANEMHSASEFSKSTIYVYNEGIISYIIEILNLENEIMATNRTEINNEIISS